MSAGQVWRRDDGLAWVEIQAAGIEPSGWRLMTPLVAPEQASAAPPLVVPLGSWHARVHLTTGVPADRLGRPETRLTARHVDLLRDALAAVIARR